MRRLECIDTKNLELPGELIIGEKYWIDNKSISKDKDGNETVMVYYDSSKINRKDRYLLSNFGPVTSPSFYSLGHVLDCTEIFKKKVKDGEIFGVGEGDDMIYNYGYFIANDVLDFHVYRVQVGINSEYEKEPRTKIVECHDVDNEDVDDLLKSEHLSRNNIFNIINAVIRLDDEDGFENDDVKEYRYDTPLERIYDEIDGGYGITVVATQE